MLAAGLLLCAVICLWIHFEGGIYTPHPQSIGISLCTGQRALQIGMDRRGVDLTLMWSRQRPSIGGRIFGGSWEHKIINAFGFRFCYLGSTVLGSDYIEQPFVGVGIPFWFICALPAGLLLLFWRKRRRAIRSEAPSETRGFPVAAQIGQGKI